MSSTQRSPVFSKGRDLATTKIALEQWLAARLDDESIQISGLQYPTGAGVSNETILFEARSLSTGSVLELVLRTAPSPDYQLFLDADLRLQHEVLRVLRHEGTVRVPEALWYEDDATVLGQPFFVMRRLRGRVPVSMPVYNTAGWLFEATPAQRRSAWESAMHQLAAIHAVPVEKVQILDMPHRGSSGLEQQLSYWRDLAMWAAGGDALTMVLALFDWLLERMSMEEPAGLSWGDARIGNMMFDDDFRVVGVMDWEQASLGGAVSDLGWWLYFDDLHSTAAGLSRLDGLGTRQETVALWETLTGRQVGDLRWHEVFAALKTALLSMRAFSVLTLKGTNLGADRSDALLAQACRLAGIRRP